MIGLNEIALIGLIVVPFIYMMKDHPVKCKRELNREERRKRK